MGCSSEPSQEGGKHGGKCVRRVWLLCSVQRAEPGLRGPSPSLEGQLPLPNFPKHTKFEQLSDLLLQVLICPKGISRAAERCLKWCNGGDLCFLVQ